jgi:hypothetical protein
MNISVIVWISPTSMWLSDWNRKQLAALFSGEEQSYKVPEMVWDIEPASDCDSFVRTQITRV